MRSLYILLLTLSSTFSYSQDKLKVITSATIFKDMAEQVGGEKVDVKSICAVGTDPHTYEPIPDDVISMRNADVIFINGLTLEGWMEKLINNSGGNAEFKVISDGVPAIKSEAFNNSYDPHAWMDLRNGIQYANNIKNTFIKVDPENKAYYESRFKAYEKELKELHNYILKEIASIPSEKRLMITSHDAFEYYSRAYFIDVSALQGMSTEAEAQSSDLIRINKQIKESGVPAIFAESTISPKMQKEIARQNNIIIGGELYADSLSEEGGHADTYTKMLKHNTDTITKALKMEKSPNNIDKKGGNNILLYLGIAALMILSLVAAMKFMK